MRVGICPGSFDPVTKGHVDIFERSAQLVDKLIVAVFVNPGKKPMFSMEERVALLKEATTHIPNVEVDAFSGLLNDYVRQRDSRLIIRGLRAFSDFMMTRGEYSFISSSGIKELAMFRGDVGRLVPPCVLTALEEKLAVAK